VPDSVNTSLADVLPTAASALGCGGFVRSFDLGTPRNIVCLLVDGLGFGSLTRHDPDWLRRGHTQPITSVLPTTTAVALTSLGTGVLPGTHGMIAASFVLPEINDVLSPLHWGSVPVPESVQVEPTVLETMSRSGIACHSVGPADYVQSGLTRAALRGPRYHGAREIPEYVATVTSILSGESPSFTYVYWPELDRIGHARGVHHPEWRTGLARVGDLVAGLQGALGADDLLLVTSDHGMVECPPLRRLRWDDLAELRTGVRAVTGEPRCRLIYLEDGVDAEGMVKRWRDRLAPDFDIWGRVDFAESGLLGPVEPFASERLGDLIVLATGDSMISCPDIDPRISSLPGQHGSWTDEERLIPLSVFTQA
jgi:hypothetical protein